MDVILGALRLFGRDESSCASMTAFLTSTLGMNQVSGIKDGIGVRPGSGPLIVVQQARCLPAGVEVSPGQTVIDLGVCDIDALWREWEWQGVTFLTNVLGLEHDRAFYARMPEGYLLRMYQR